MISLELLSPARNAEIGIAAIDCGADAVYMAGPSFGARADAGNTVADVARLCAYASRFGVRVYATVNTILYDGELEEAGRLLCALQEAGVSAFIVQDPAVVTLARRLGITVPLHASTQCAIRTPEKARFHEDSGFSRLVLERQMSLEQIAAVRAAVDAELEFFIHGALCMCYSGECYLSEYLAHRSANRGGCVQACRAFYDLVDASGRRLVRDRALLSLKDFNLSGRLADLAAAGVCSFKIEGRLKGADYVKNVTGMYSRELDALVESSGGRYRRASFGRVRGGFEPAPEKTFNRGYTSLYIDGRRGSWASMDLPKGHGEEVGIVRSTVRRGKGTEIVLNLRPGVTLANGDGFVYASGRETVGFRGDVCRGSSVVSDAAVNPAAGTVLYRNLDTAFEKKMAAEPCRREIPVAVSAVFSRGDAGFTLTASAESEDGRKVSVTEACGDVAAENRDRMVALVESQLGKRAGDYAFTVSGIEGDVLPLVRSAELNAVRRRLSEELDSLPCKNIPLRNTALASRDNAFVRGRSLSYKFNCANALTREFYEKCGAAEVDDAFEKTHAGGAELMRSRYCLRNELGMCLRNPATKMKGPLFLENNGRRFALGFDCAKCEMTVSLPTIRKQV